MSDNNSQNDTIETESKPPENEEQPNTDKYAGIENSIKTHVIHSDSKNIMQNQESIINVHSNTDMDEKNQGIKIKDANLPDDKCKIHRKNESLVKSQYRSQIQPPKSTWVAFNYGGTALPFHSKELFYDPSDNGFVRRMLTIYLAMLLFTFALATLFWLLKIKKLMILKNLFRSAGVLIAISATIILIALVFAMACLPCTRLFPFNIVSLVLAVICTSVIHAWMALSTATGYQTLFATIIIVFVCILITCTKFEFTNLFLYVIVIIVAYFVVVFVFILFVSPIFKDLPPKRLSIMPNPMDFVKLLVATILNAVIVVAELHIILEGKCIEMGQDDYTLGAFLLYTSVIDLFLKLPQKLCSKDY